jgi:crotonobetainyl-CoA:carnitine CoA-transferase CaiB-like acyl-CoA transferase
LSIAADEWRWDKFKACLGCDALDDSRFATHALREANALALIPILDDIFASRDQAEWRRILDEAGLIFGIVADMDEIAEDEQILASAALVRFSDGSALTVNSPLWIAGQDKVAPRSAPSVGQHSGEILRDAGYPETEISALREAGIIG